MLKPQNRLKKKTDITFVFDHGRFVGGDLVNIKVWHVNPETSPKRGYTKDDLKVAFIVGKKVHKSAVKRNSMKRKMREVVRLLLREKKLRPGNLVVIMAKPTMGEKEYTQIETSIQKALRKAKVVV